LKKEILRRRVEKYFRVFGRPEGLEMSDLLSDLDPSLTLHELEDELKSRGVDLSRLEKHAPEEFEVTPARMNEYGFIYVRKGFRRRLPFAARDPLTLEVLDDIVIVASLRSGRYRVSNP
jgi:hypothetical protein